MIKRLCIVLFLFIVSMSVFYYLDNKDNFEYRRARQAFTTGGDEKAFQIAQKILL